jgi:hypothetical protein
MIKNNQFFIWLKLTNLLLLAKIISLIIKLFLELILKKTF